MVKILISSLLLLAAGCAGAPASGDSSSAETDGECQSHQVVVEEDDRRICVDRDILERERLIIESEEHW